MQTYESYVNEALENYAKLPQEMNELYKRHHITIPDGFNFQADSKEDMSGMINDYKQSLGIDFDIAIGSQTHVIKDNKHIKFEQFDAQGDKVSRMLHKNSDDKFVALINAHSRRFVSIDIPKNSEVELKILFMNSELPHASHVFVNVQEGAKLKLVEIYASSAMKRSMLGVIHEINSAPNSNVEIDALHNENSNTVALGFMKNKMGDHSNLKFNTFYNGAESTRVRNFIDAGGATSEISVNEVILGSKTQKFDINTHIINTGRESNASLESKAVMMDSSFCLLKGFAKVMRGAARSRSYVHERGIILDRSARVDGLPDMSVEESDVKATHSSATAPVDPEAIFYLMSKSIDELGVRKLIVSGFLAESISKMHNEDARRLSIALVNSKLENKEFGQMPKVDKENIWDFGEEREKDMFLGHYKYR